MKILTIIISFVLLNVNILQAQHSYDSTKMRPNVLKIVTKLSKFKRVEGVFVGFVGTPSKIYQLGKKLRVNSTRDELIELTFHPNPIIRAYSFWGLAERKETGTIDLLLEHLDDTVTINTMFGDYGESVYLADFMINLIVPEYLYTADYLYPNNTILDVKERYLIDSAVIFNDNDIKYKNTALLYSIPNPDFYHRIKELSLRDNIYAIVALAKYKNSEDTLLIKNSYYFNKTKDSYFESFYYTFWAFSEFPNECFENFTMQVFDSVISSCKDEQNLRTLFRAIASFKNPSLNKYLKNNTKTQNYYFFIGMSVFADEVFDSLMFNIWDKDKIVTKNGFMYLNQRDKNRSLQLIIQTIEPENKFLKIPDLSFWVNQSYKSTLDVMFDTLYRINRNKALVILNSKLRTSDYKELEFYCAKAKSIKDTSLINSILMRLKTDEVNTFQNDNYWHLMEVIVSLNEARYDELMIDSILQNEYVTQKMSKNRKSISDDIELMRWSMSNTKSLDQLELDKYR